MIDNISTKVLAELINQDQTKKEAKENILEAIGCDIFELNNHLNDRRLTKQRERLYKMYYQNLLLIKEVKRLKEQIKKTPVC